MADRCDPILHVCDHVDLSLDQVLRNGGSPETARIGKRLWGFYRLYIRKEAVKTGANPAVFEGRGFVAAETANRANSGS